MGTELTLAGASTGSTIYATVRRNSDEKIWNTSTSEFETAVNASQPNYAVTMTETPAGSKFWYGNMPTAIAAGTLVNVVYWRKLGGSPAVTDQVMAGETMRADGTLVSIPDSDLLTLEEYETFIGGADAALADQRSQMISWAIDEVLSICDEGLIAAERTEDVWGTGCNYLHLAARPISEVNEVTLWPDTDLETVIPGSNFFGTAAGTIHYRPDATDGSRYFPEETRIRVTYTAGYSNVPGDIKKAICYLVQHNEFTSDPDVLVTEKSVRDGKIKYDGVLEGDSANDPLLGRAMELLRPYMNIACI